MTKIINELVEGEMQRLLGVDFGSKRIGLSLSDETRKFALPLKVVPNNPELITEVEKIAKENGVKTVIIGESRNYKGEPNVIYEKADAFKTELEKRGFSVKFELEFMSSMQAERIQGKNEMTDASAAAIILQSYLDKIVKQHDEYNF